MFLYINWLKAKKKSLRLELESTKVVGQDEAVEMFLMQLEEVELLMTQISL